VPRRGGRRSPTVDAGVSTLCGGVLGGQRDVSRKELMRLRDLLLRGSGSVASIRKLSEEDTLSTVRPVTELSMRR